MNEMNTGGAETFLMKIFRALDKTRYQMDFYCMSQGEGFYEKEIISLGGRVYHSIPKSKGFFKYFFTLINTVKKNKYNYVMRVSEHSLGALDLLAAKIGGAKVLVQRSSNADSDNKIGRLLHILFKWLAIVIPTVKIAPSSLAAEYTFGRNCVKGGKVILLHNALPVEKYTFNNDMRNLIREELGVTNNFVVGHVGRFAVQKNHDFLIDIFAEIKKKKENAVLVLVGEGTLKENIRIKAEKLNLGDSVKFLEIRNDIPNLMMAMDIFLFPSFYEGMPNAVIEAQAAGLPCIISNNITKEVQITNLVKYMSINNTSVQWAEAALTYNNNNERQSMKKIFEEKGYEISGVTKKFIKAVFNDVYSILFVMPSMGYGGAERVISILANNFAQKGHSVKILTTSSTKPSVYKLNKKIQLQGIPSVNAKNAAALFKLLRKIREITKAFNPNIIISFINDVSAIMLLANLGTGYSLIHSERNDPSKTNKGVKDKMFKFIVKLCASGFVFQSNGAKKLYPKRVQKKSCIILNPISTENLPKHYDGEREKIIVTAGRLHPQKNQQMLIRAFSHIAEEYPEYSLVIYGEGTLRETLQKQIDALGMAERIFLKGNTSDLLEKMNTASIFAFTSDYEGLPNALMEAMALGLPCISTDCSPGGASELIQNKVSGILVPAKDEMQFTEGLRYLLSHPNKAAEMGNEARKIIEIAKQNTIAFQWEEFILDILKWRKFNDYGKRNSSY